MTTDDPSPELLCEASSPSEAYAIAADLRELGIESIVVTEDAVRIDAISTTSRSTGVPVLVPASDLDAARERLTVFRAAARDVDWAAQDVGERTDDLPLHTPGRMPPLARVAFVVAAIVLIVGLIAGAIAIAV